MEKLHISRKNTKASFFRRANSLLTDLRPERDADYREDEQPEEGEGGGEPRVAAE